MNIETSAHDSTDATTPGPIITAISIGGTAIRELARSGPEAVQGVTFMALTPEESSESIGPSIEDTDMLFVIAEADDAAATSTAARIGQLALKNGTLAIAIPIPGSPHKKSLSRQPYGVAPMLAGNLDAIIVLPLEESAGTTNDGSLTPATGDMILAAIAGIAESVTARGLIKLDIADLKILLSGAGVVGMGIACASGKDRATVAAERAIANLSTSGCDIETADGVLINFTATDSLKLKEVAAVLDLFDHTNKKPLVIVAAVAANTVGDELRLTLFATALGGGLPFVSSSHETNALCLYKTVWQRLLENGAHLESISCGKELLAYLGLSKQERYLLWRLNWLEINDLSRILPQETPLIRAYLKEIAQLLPKLQRNRKPDYSGSYLTPCMLDTLKVSAHLRYAKSTGHIKVAKYALIEILTPGNDKTPFHERFAKAMSDAALPKAKTVSIDVALRLIALYLDEYIACSKDIDWNKDRHRHVTDWEHPINRLMWGMPHVMQWFFDLTPLTDEALMRRGWNYLIGFAKQRAEYYPANYVQRSDPLESCSWPCKIERNYADWCSSIPSNRPYQLIPLTSNTSLYEEHEALNNDAAAYIGSCLRNECRLFSIRDANTARRIATAWLYKNDDVSLWEMREIEGKDRERLTNRLSIEDDPMSTLLNAAAAWYNRNLKQRKIGLAFQYTAMLDGVGRLTDKSGIRNIFCTSISPQTSDICERQYADLCFSHNVILNDLGYAGSWPGCREALIADGWTANKIAQLKHFAEDMQIGDWILLRNGSDTVLGIGEVVGDYEWLDEFDEVKGWALQHARRVRWMKKARN